ncbi:ribonuclease J [Capsulimonas corticalis]|uniref:Ribonuclease J n=1 Tax=Capsulimonas corticalis TaxID=2219043 RepID=A0A402CXL3_9BACT|nr:ribonuclease J [Capsulimonas corticalis]BDI32272.1 ribonuclease J [Capsulimonas corticalis]
MANKTPKTDTLQIIPLGGIGEIGKNMTAIRCGDQIVVIDCGLSFPGAEQLGVDLVIPDISYLLEHKEMVQGIILTHGHEDHIGALAFVLKELNVPVYGTRLTIGFTKGKLAEHRVLDKAKLHVFSANDKFRLGIFEIEPFRVAHSIPDAVGFAVHTPAGTLVHTGDFKFDQTPVDGQLFDIAKLTRIGQEGVLVLLSDCTNVERPGFVPSEATVAGALENIFRAAQRRVIMACFASNVHRVQTAIDMSVKYGRKVALMGRSMERNMEMAQQMGYLRVPEGTRIRADEIEDYFPQQVTVITTGSQGEPMAALSRMAVDDHRKIKIVPGDTVILAASAVPGNEDAVWRTVNHLFRRGAEVIYDSIAPVHVSGHGYAEELKLMLNLVDPQYVMPVHGEYRMLHRYAQIAGEMGWPQEDVIRGEIGDIIEVSEEVAGVVGRVEKSGAVLIDGTGIGDVSEIVLRDRLHIGQDGFLVLVVGVSAETGEIVSGPEVISRGFVYMDQSEALVEEIKTVIIEKIKNLPEEDNDWMVVQQDLRDAVGKFLYKKTQRRPMILPILLDL